MDTLLSGQVFFSGSRPVHWVVIWYCPYLSVGSLRRTNVIRQSSPSKCVSKSGIAHFVFILQYYGAVCAVISVSPKLVMHCCSGPISFWVFFHKSCYLMSQCTSYCSQQSSSFHACLEDVSYSVDCMFTFLIMVFFFFALLFLILRSIQYDKCFT